MGLIHGVTQVLGKDGGGSYRQRNMVDVKVLSKFMCRFCQKAEEM